ncbi:prostate stem cell antigen [Dama dama]|uniref:prostate stem cell antigen n=1 Tax=Dama dama TaxID=30532 RepID=UPI002A359D69|nr:prostate stem cell antigen [Dama dama]
MSAELQNHCWTKRIDMGTPFPIRPPPPYPLSTHPPRELGQGRWVSAQGPALPSISTPPPHPEAIGLLTVTSKGCSSHCVEDARNSFGSKKNACCCTNLSKASGAHTLQLAGVTLALLAALGCRPLWGRAQL